MKIAWKNFYKKVLLNLKPQRLWLINSRINLSYLINLISWNLRRIIENVLLINASIFNFNYDTLIR